MLFITTHHRRTVLKADVQNRRFDSSIRFALVTAIDTESTTGGGARNSGRYSERSRGGWGGSRDCDAAIRPTAVRSIKQPIPLTI